MSTSRHGLSRKLAVPSCGCTEGAASRGSDSRLAAIGTRRGMHGGSCLPTSTGIGVPRGFGAIGALRNGSMDFASESPFQALRAGCSPIAIVSRAFSAYLPHGSQPILTPSLMPSGRSSMRQDDREAGASVTPSFHVGAREAAPYTPRRLVSSSMECGIRQWRLSVRRASPVAASGSRNSCSANSPTSRRRGPPPTPPAAPTRRGAAGARRRRPAGCGRSGRRGPRGATARRRRSRRPSRRARAA